MNSHLGRLLDALGTSPGQHISATWCAPHQVAHVENLARQLSEVTCSQAVTEYGHHPLTLFAMWCACWTFHRFNFITDFPQNDNHYEAILKRAGGKRQPNPEWQAAGLGDSKDM